MTHATCRLTAKNRDQLRNPTLGNGVWATFTFTFYHPLITRLKMQRGFRDCNPSLCVADGGDVQSTFQRMMTEIYEQEHETMMSIIDDARRSLAVTVDQLRDEQQVLALTADKISQSPAVVAHSLHAVL